MDAYGFLSLRLKFLVEIAVELEQGIKCYLFKNTFESKQLIGFISFMFQHVPRKRLKKMLCVLDLVQKTAKDLKKMMKCATKLRQSNENTEKILFL